MHRGPARRAALRPIVLMSHVGDVTVFFVVPTSGLDTGYLSPGPDPDGQSCQTESLYVPTLTLTFKIRISST